MAAVVAAAGLVLAGCDNLNGPKDDGPKTLVITGLPQGWTGASAALWDGANGNAGAPAGGDAVISNGTARISLKNLDSGNGTLSGGWTGSGTYYVALWSRLWNGNAGNAQFRTKTAVSFTSETTTIQFADFEEIGSGNRGEKIGEIKGAVTLTGIPSPVPKVYIYASGNSWSSYSSQIDLSGISGTTGTAQWTIPLYENDVYTGTWDTITGQQTVNFTLNVDSGSSSFEIRLGALNIDMTSKDAIQSPSLTASLAAITLNGTITVTTNGQPVSRVQIYATTQQGWLGSTSINSPGAGASWSLSTPPFDSPTDVSFNVVGYDSNGGRIFEKSAVKTVSGVSNQPVSGITLDIGDVATITLSGTITVTDGGSPIPRVTIQANNANGSYIAQTSLESPAAGASWSMTIAAQEGEKVSFYVYGYDSPNGGNSVFSKTLEPDKTASVTDQSISGIALDIGDISAGRMSGTVSFTNIQNPAPYRIRLGAQYKTGNDWTSITGNRIYDITVSETTGTWVIPQDSAFLAALETGDQTVRFVVSLGFNQNNYLFTMASIEKTVSKNGLTSIDLGSVNLAYATLSGTITVTDGGNPIPWVSIDAYDANGNYLSWTSLESPASGASWYINIPAQDGGKITFRVYGYDSPSGGNEVFYKYIEPDKTNSVTSGEISGIALDIGDISVGRMSGTVSFTDMPSPAPYRINVFAQYQTNNGWTWINDGGWNLPITVSGTTGTWAIPQDSAFLAALETGAQTVMFLLDVQLIQGEDSFRIAEIEKTISKNGLTSIDLGSVSLAYAKLSGTINVTNGGSPIPQVYIGARNANGNNIGWTSTYLESPEAGASWSLYIPAQQPAAAVSFRVSCYNNDGNWIFDTTISPEATNSVGGQPITGITLDIGDISLQQGS
jgi:hypothetical protein